MKDEKRTEIAKAQPRQKAGEAKSVIEKKTGREERRNNGVGRETLGFMAPAFTFRPTP